MPLKFEEICKNIEEKNLEKLEGEWLDISKAVEPYFYTPAYYFASQNKHDEVEALRNMGASPEYIAAGYVVAGNDKKVSEYEDEYGVSKNFISEIYGQH